MTIAYWPVALPSKPLVAGLTAQRQDNKIGVQPEVGDAKVRRRFTGTMKDFAATFVLTAAARATLDDFHDATLQDGVLPFAWVDPQTSEAATFRFVSPPQWSKATAGAWRATCQLRRID